MHPLQMDNTLCFLPLTHRSGSSLYAGTIFPKACDVALAPIFENSLLNQRDLLYVSLKFLIAYSSLLPSQVSLALHLNSSWPFFSIQGEGLHCLGC